MARSAIARFKRGCGGGNRDRIFGASVQHSAFTLAVAFFFLLDVSAVVSGIPIRKLAWTIAGHRKEGGGDMGAASKLPTINRTDYDYRAQQPPMQRPQSQPVPLSAVDDCLEPNDCTYPDKRLSSMLRRRVGDRFQDDSKAAGADNREREIVQDYSDDEDAAESDDGGGGGGKIVTGGRVPAADDSDGSGGGGAGAEDLQQKGNAERPDETSFENNESDAQLPSEGAIAAAAISATSAAAADDGEATNGNSDDYNGEGADDNGVAAVTTAGDGQPHAPQFGDWRSSDSAAIAASDTSAVESHEQVKGNTSQGVEAVGSAAHESDKKTPQLASKTRLQMPCSDGAPAGVPLDLQKMVAVGKGLRSTTDVNSTFDSGNLSAVLATTFGSVSVVLLLIINGFVIRRTWVHGCRKQKSSQVLLRSRRVACRRRHNRYATTRGAEPDETGL